MTLKFDDTDGDNNKAQGAVIQCRIAEELIRGERQRWRAISTVSSGMEFGMRSSFGDARRYGSTPWRGGPYSKT